MMKIEVDEFYDLVVSEVFSPLTVKAERGKSVAITNRDETCTHTGRRYILDADGELREHH